MSDHLGPLNSFTFVRLAALRAAQLMRGCTPRVTPSVKATSTARREVAAGFVEFGHEPPVPVLR
jgi:DNA-directed RNA polymerase subunit K/omega